MIKIPETQNIETSKLKADGQNPNRMSKERFQALKKNLKRYGFVVPIITNNQLMIADGEHRWKAAQELGMKQVPVVQLKVKEVDRRMLRQIMNKLRGDHDHTLDLEEFDYIYGEGKYEDFRELLPDMAEYEELMQKRKEDKDPDDFNTRKAITKPKYSATVGDLWQLGDHKLMCGDSTNGEHLARLMGDDEATMIFTDPPYGVSYMGTNNPNGREWTKMKNDELRGPALFEFITKAFSNAYNVTSPEVAVYCCYATINHMEFETALKEAKYRIKQVLVWNKGHILGHSDYHWTHEPIIYAVKDGFNCKWYGNRTHKTVLDSTQKNYKPAYEVILMLVNGKEPKKWNEKFETRQTLQPWNKDRMVNYYGKITNVWDDIPFIYGGSIRHEEGLFKPGTNKKEHPAQCPIKLVKRCIGFCTDKGDVVLDPFIGSGTTACACAELGRACIGYDISENYVNLALKRLEQGWYRNKRE